MRVDDRRGELWPMDRFGRAMNAGDRTALTPLGRRVARSIADGYRDRLGSSLHSVYLSGAFARGRVGPVRAFGVLRMTASPMAVAWLEEVSGSVRARWPGVGRPELSLHAWREVFPAGDAFSPTRFQLGVNSVCLVGRDLARLVAPQRLNIPAANSWIVAARERVEGALARVDLAAREEEVAQVCAETARFLLAAGFALVMPHEGVFTEDPDLQRDFIVLNHPERRQDADLVHRFANEPTSSAADVIDMLEGYGRWLTTTSDAWLDRNNPQRLAALPA
jgi:hypothetical protein